MSPAAIAIARARIPAACSRKLIAIVGIGLVGGILACESLVVLAIVIGFEGLVVGLTLGGAALAGGWVLHLCRTGIGHVHYTPGAAPPSGIDARVTGWAERLVIGGALGIGLLPIIVLIISTLGLLNHTLAWVLILVVAVAGLTRVFLDYWADQRHPRPPESLPPAPSLPVVWGRWLWLLAAPFLGLAIAGASLPPGILWGDEEANAYDVLEYHLAVPKTFHQQGRTAFLPNNVYANFPLAGEMYSLLMMTLHGNAIDAAFMCQLVNVVLSALFVAAAWLAGREFSVRCGLLAGLLAATTPWVAYLAGIAYAEPGMLALGMAALAAMLRTVRRTHLRRRWAIIAGGLAGLTCGFKYTAVPMIALPIALLPLAATWHWRRRLLGVGLAAAAATLAFSPWMVRNVVNTRNPVFPLGYSIFGARAGVWDAELAARWDNGHRLSDKERAAHGWLRLAYLRTLRDPRMSLLVFALAAAAPVRRLDRWNLGLLLILLSQLVIWLTATHLFARFAVVMLIPMLVLAGRSIEGLKAGRGLAAVGLLLIITAAGNLVWLGRLYYHHTRVEGQRINAFGRTDWFTQGHWPGTAQFAAINQLGEDARVMLVGEARTYYIQRACEYAVVFNRHPLGEAARRLVEPLAIVDWLKERGTTHLLVDWGEIRRLRNTYGLDEALTPELFVRLRAAGLREERTFALEEGREPYATLYEVLDHE